MASRCERPMRAVCAVSEVQVKRLQGGRQITLTPNRRYGVN